LLTSFSLHFQAVFETASAENEEDGDGQFLTPRVSLPYPLSSCADLQYRLHVQIDGNAIQEMQPSLPSFECQCGQHYSETGYVLVNSSCTVFNFAPHYTHTAQLYDLCCPLNNPACRIEYNGTQDGFFRHSKASFISLR
jgi:hypothetical protein